MKEKRKNISKKQLLMMYAVVAIILIVSKAIGALIRVVVMNPYYQEFLCEVVPAVIGVVAVWYLHKMEIFQFRKDGWLEGAAALGAPLTISILGLFIFFKTDGVITASKLEVTAFLLEMLLIGVAEEIPFRGLLQNACHEYFGEDTLLKRYLGIIVPGASFGLIHFVNLLKGVSFGAVFSQAITAIPMGALLCAAYYRSGKNLWVCILVHALIDCSSLLNGGSLSGMAETAILEENGGSPWVAFVFYLAIAAFVMRPEKIREV